MRFWKMSEVRFVEANYMQMTDAEIGTHLNRSRESVEGYRMRNGLVKPKLWAYFKKGHQPWNKGTNYDAGGRAKETRFKDGHLPHNTKSDYDISLRKDKSGRAYKYIRLSLGKWVPLHRYIWEMFNGEIPKGFIIVFRNGNTMDCYIDNLEMISRAENVKRNHNIEACKIGMKKHWELCRTKELFGIKTSRHGRFKHIQ